MSEKNQTSDGKVEPDEDKNATGEDSSRAAGTHAGDEQNGSRKKNAKSEGKDDHESSQDKSSQDESGRDASAQDENDNGEDEDDVIKVARTTTSPALLSQLQHSRQYSKARGLGAGGTGAATFRVQRLTALALIPLVIWFAVSVVRLSTGTHAQAAAWLAWPVNAAIMALFIVIALRHAVIGLQIIFEDYVHGEALRATCVLAVKAIALVLGVAAVAALIHLSS